MQIDLSQPIPDVGLGSLRILALGGSTTYGSNLERNQTYPAVLDRLLNERFPEKSIEVLNAGVPWHTSMHSLMRYVAIYARWKPDIVIIMHAFNDIFQTSEGKLTIGRFREDNGHFFGALGNRVNPRDQFTEGISNLLTKNWLARTWYSDLSVEESKPPSLAVDLFRALPSFHRNLSELVKRATSDNAQVILLTQPFLYREEMSQQVRSQLFYDYYYKDYALVPTINEQQAAIEAFNETARTVSRSTGTILLDLERIIPKTEKVMYDDVHYTVHGAEKVAKAVADGVPWEELLYKNSR